MLKNTDKWYGDIAKFFHWVVAALLFGMFMIAYVMINLPKTDFRFSLYDIHKATGILLFSLIAFRFIWRLINIQPTLPASLPRWQRSAAHVNILSLYLLMILMPITGFFTSTLGGHAISFYSLITISPLAHDKAASLFFSYAHEIVSILLIVAFFLHIMGAYYHHYVLKDDILKRMLKRTEGLSA